MLSNDSFKLKVKNFTFLTFNFLFIGEQFVSVQVDPRFEQSFPES